MFHENRIYILKVYNKTGQDSVGKRLFENPYVEGLRNIQKKSSKYAFIFVNLMLFLKINYFYSFPIETIFVPPMKDFETLPKGSPLLLLLPALLGVAGVEGWETFWI